MADRVKLYQRVAQDLESAIRAGQFIAGSRLPPERDLADQFAVSRPTIREAMIALEIRGLVEVRHGSGVYVSENRIASCGSDELNVGAFELIEARLMFEGEAAALAAAVIPEDQLLELRELLERMELLAPESPDELVLDRNFHLAIARGTQSSVVLEAIERLWDLREKSPLSRRMFEQARVAGIVPRADEHRRIYDAIARRDGDAARIAMRSHLTRVSEDLLTVTELELIEKAKKEIGDKRRRIGGVVIR